MKSKWMFLMIYLLAGFSTAGQQFTKSDTLRGSITAERVWWDVLKYDISITPHFDKKIITGKNTITYKVISAAYSSSMQIDLQYPLVIDSVKIDKKHLSFQETDINTWMVKPFQQNKESQHKITIFYHGQPREAVKPPWDGGWIWKKDALARPWMSVTCQGWGASVWFPCKDHQSDEPDNGASLSITIPDTLVAVANGNLSAPLITGIDNNTATYRWSVKAPINSYCIIPYIGKYINFQDTYSGEKGLLRLNYWVLDYNLQKAKQHFTQVKKMLTALEYWFGPYPFYEDGYKLVESPHLGMEHQSAIAYGNNYRNGYNGKDLSESGWGENWDFIIVHESGHEWFGNSITSKDIADMWIHESFTTYSETLFTEYYYGKEAGNDYCYGIRKLIENDKSIISHYDVNKGGSDDMYYKGANMLHSIRHSIDNDEKFRKILRGLNKTFYHQTVTTQQIESYINKRSGIDFSKVFKQYLTTTQIPKLHYYFSEKENKIFYRWVNCIEGFNMPLVIRKGKQVLKIKPETNWKEMPIQPSQKELWNPLLIERLYYITTVQRKILEKGKTIM